MQTHAVSVLAAVAAAGSAASAQTFNSFRLADSLGGVTVETLSPLSYRVSLSADPTMTFGGTDFPITDVIGFWALSEDDDLSGSTSDFAQWAANANNASTGGILGWRTNPNTGIVPSGSQVFTFDSLPTSSVEAWGFHVRIDGTFPGTSGNTGHVYVPSPGVPLVAGCAAAWAWRRRRRGI